MLLEGGVISGDEGVIDLGMSLCYAYCMKRKNDPLEKNLLYTTAEAFLENYNKSIPASFPQAAADALIKFQAANPSLFKKNNMWSIDRHRKRLMDWLSSQQKFS